MNNNYDGNVDTAFGTKLEWILKRYQVNNDNKIDNDILNLVQYVIYQINDNYDGTNLNAKFQLKYEYLIEDLNGVQRNDLEWILKNNDNYDDNNLNAKFHLKCIIYQMNNNYVGNNLNANFQLKCKYLIETLDGIQRRDLEFYNYIKPYEYAHYKNNEY